MVPHQPQHAVLTLQVHRHTLRDVVTGQHRHANAQVSVNAVVELESCPTNDLITHLLGGAHFYIVGRLLLQSETLGNK